MIRRLIILLLIVGMMFAQDSNIDSTLYFYKSGDKLHFGYNSPKKTSLNVNEFVAIYYDDGSMSTYDNTETTCSISFGVNLEKKYLLVDCHMFANGDSENIINVALIPHTLEMTTLGSKDVGDSLNIETDIIGKYIERLMSFEDDDDQMEELLLKGLKNWEFGES